MTRTRWSALLAALALVLGACGGGDDDDASGGDGRTTASGGSAITALDDVERATVRIVATGSFVDPAAGLQLNAAGSGSGFLIDPDGIVVTNNHVVTGAATLEVYVGGEDDPRNAKVLGVSECSDLAVIDIAGDGYPYLTWFDGEIKAGLGVYAAGYPLGDPEFTLTRGIVSKKDADGESSWASVDGVVEHDARINPGNSGGPLVTEDGLVVGINYAGASETDQNFAISETEAGALLEQLRKGEDVNSVGINGEAFYDDTLGGGIWVYSVESGSPADQIGVQGGDIVTRFEGLAVAEDGTMATYCDVLRTHDAGDELAIEIYRADTEQRFEGSVNGDPLTEVFELSEDLDTDAVGDSGEDQGITGTYDYTTITDDAGVIQVDVPTMWSDIDGSAGQRGPSVEASPDLATYREAWSVPGVSIGATLEQGPADQETLLDEYAQDACTSEGRQPYDDTVYTGFYDYYTGCGGTQTALVNIAASPADGTFLIFVSVQMVDDADLKALDQIIATFQVIGDLAGAAG
ncbi:MAG TPA: S1C family serine protease [Acidimicrobiales bacterium]|nr:S1C family serine protease [Acidimicrobiales bacterium]